MSDYMSKCIIPTILWIALIIKNIIFDKNVRKDLGNRIVSVKSSAHYLSQTTEDANLLHTHCAAMTFILEEVLFHFMLHIYINIYIQSILNPDISPG